MAIDSNSSVPQESKSIEKSPPRLKRRPIIPIHYRHLGKWRRAINANLETLEQPEITENPRRSPTHVWYRYVGAIEASNSLGTKFQTLQPSPSPSKLLETH